MEETSIRKGIAVSTTIRDTYNHFEDRKDASLLSLRYKAFCVFAGVFYIILQFVIGLNYIPVQPNYETIPSTKVAYLTICAGSAFAISVIQQMMRIRECRQENKKDLQGVHFSILTMSSIAGSSFFLTFALNWGGTLTDVLGVHSSGAQWAEWLVTVPMMVFMALAIENKPRLTKDDIIILLVFATAICFAFLLNVEGMPIELGWAMFILGCCSLTAKIVVDKVNKVSPDLHSNYGHVFANSKKNVCFRLFIFIFPLYPLTHILAQSKVLDKDNTIIAYGIISVIAKLLFAGYLSKVHVEVVRIKDEVICSYWLSRSLL